MGNRIELSIIVPVYNVAPYLRDCIESLLDQGFSEDEYEVIMVDDGSTDTSFEIIQKYAREHRCIKAIHQDNAGVSAARNTGLDHAKGEYIAFVDGDDFLVAGALSKLCGEAQKRDADTLMYSNAVVNESTRFVHGPNISFAFRENKDKVVISTDKIWRLLINHKIIDSHALRFPNGLKYGEDTFFAGLVSMFVQADKQVFCDSCVYYYRIRTGSAMHTKSESFVVDYMNDMIRVIDLWVDFLNKYPELPKEKRNNVMERQYLLSSAAIFCALRSTTVDPYKIRQLLRNKKVYPYPFMLRIVTRKISIPNIIILFLRYNIIFELLAKTKILKGR